MRDEFLVFGSPQIEADEIAEVVDSLESGWIGTGPKVKRFEEMLSEYVGVRHVRCVASCTAALFLALKSLEIGPGDEVLVPAMTFVASANAVEQTGAKAVFVDVHPETGLIDFDMVQRLISRRTKAIMPVHLWGRPVNMDDLIELRDRYGLAVVEDAAHALGARWRDKAVGAFGNPTAYSFYVTKNITTIEGGALALENLDVARRIEQFALHGLNVGAWQRFSDSGFKHYEASEIGYKFNMTDVQAALGVHQLPRLDDWIGRREEVWDAYNADLAALPLRLPPNPPQHVRHARHIYHLHVTEESGIERDELLDELHRRNIGTGVHYRGVHLHPYYRNRYGLSPGDFPHSTRISDTTFSLPLSQKLTDKDRRDVVGALRDVFDAVARR